MQGVMAAWAIVHGLADLMTAGRLRFLLEMRQRERHYLQQLGLPDIAPRAEE